MRDNYPIQTPTPNIRNRVSLDKLRILLWDIDGTLMRSVRHGEYKKYFAPAMEKVYGSCGKLDSLKVSGMTDTQIMYESLRDEGFTPEQIFDEKENLLKIFQTRSICRICSYLMFFCLVRTAVRFAVC